MFEMATLVIAFLLTVSVCAAVPGRSTPELHNALLREFVVKASSRVSAYELSCFMKHSDNYPLTGGSLTQEDFSKYMVEGMTKCIPSMASTRIIVPEDEIAEGMEGNAVMKMNKTSCRGGRHPCCSNKDRKRRKLCFTLFCAGRGICKPRKPRVCNCQSGCHPCCVVNKDRKSRQRGFKVFCSKGGKCSKIH